jgi:multiple sugar transport system substrate-binding protein
VGLDPSKPPLTIGQMDMANHLLTRVAPDGTVQRAGFVHLEPGWWSFHWGQHFGGRLYDAATDRSTVACDENIKAYEWLQSYSKRFGSGDQFAGVDAQKNKLLEGSSLEQVEKFRSSFGNYDSGLNAFLSGKISMVIQGPWLANVLKAYAPDLDYGVTPFPVAEHLYDAANPIGLIDTDILVVPRGVKHPEACMEFVAFTQTQRVVEYLSTVHCKNSPLAEASPDFLASHPNKGVGVFASVANSARGFRCPQTRTWLQFKDVCDAMMQQVWTQKKPAAELLVEAQARSQVILDDAARATRIRRGAGA